MELILNRRKTFWNLGMCTGPRAITAFLAQPAGKVKVIGIAREGHYRAIAPTKNLRLAEQQKLKRIEKGEPNDICRRVFWAYSTSKIHLRSVLCPETQLGELTALPQTHSWSPRTPPRSCLSASNFGPQQCPSKKNSWLRPLVIVQLPMSSATRRCETWQTLSCTWVINSSHLDIRRGINSSTSIASLSPVLAHIIESHNAIATWTKLRQKTYNLFANSEHLSIAAVKSWCKRY